jgi:hypothetical protein
MGHFKSAPYSSEIVAALGLFPPQPIEHQLVTPQKHLKMLPRYSFLHDDLQYWTLK